MTDATRIDAFLMAYSNADFTNPHEVVLPDEPKDCRGDFTHMGAKYWGCESRRHRTTAVLVQEQALEYDHNAHNWMLIALKKRADVSRLTISTKWYTGNQVRFVTIYLKDGFTNQTNKVCDRYPLNPDSEHTITFEPTLATECFVECYFDGGISRINFFGQILSEQPQEKKNLLEKATISHVSNAHYGKPEQAVFGNRKETHMVGWESARGGFGERALFQLEKQAIINEIIVDTYMHRLNAPLTCHIYGAHLTSENTVDTLMKRAPRWKIKYIEGAEETPEDFQKFMFDQQYLTERGTKNRVKFKIKPHIPDGSPWKALLPFAPLSPDTYHRFRIETIRNPITHILYMHYPNGGIHGLKVFGTEV